MRAREFLVEKRKNPEINNQYRGNLLQRLQAIRTKYPNDMIYVRFIDFDKLGINSKYNFNTPVGIYGYPIDFVLQTNGKVPFAGSRVKVIVFRIKNPELMLNLDTADYREVAKRFHDSILKLYQEEWDFSQCSSNRDAWYRMYDFIKSYNKDKRQHIVAYQIIKGAGYHGAMDTVGIIHGNEYQQGFFFYVKDLQVIDSISNNPFEQGIRSDYYLIDIKDVPENIQNKNKDKIKAFILQHSPNQFQYASKTIKNDKDFVLRLAYNYVDSFPWSVYRHLSDLLRGDIEFVKLLFDYNSERVYKDRMYYYSTKKVRADKEIIKGMLIDVYQFNDNKYGVSSDTLDFESILQDKELTLLAGLYIGNFTEIVISKYKDLIDKNTLLALKINCAIYSESVSNVGNKFAINHHKISFDVDELSELVHNSNPELRKKYIDIGNKFEQKYKSKPYKDPNDPWEEMPWD